ncbi:hypothetical protein STCU_05510 [Strigomonas culicis]|nr:hypothetical protein STCU_05510 [Strigomonas culicis]|eukprot:EPY27828.1 hypothetical protein STCU_05510 [Strigomonas culicis]
MMLGFGLSSNIWMCATFRFFHGLFNGNILVAKTMMADITDKTNETKGFAFISLVSAVGFLLGPALGGILYNPAYSDTMKWAHFSTDGLFATYPALLPSLVIFVYTMIGNAVCTFFIQESNPKAQPLPWLVRCVFPCLWVPGRPFVAMKPKGDVEVTVETGDADVEEEIENGGSIPYKSGEGQRALDAFQNEPLSLIEDRGLQPATSAAGQRKQKSVSISRGDGELADYPICVSSRPRSRPSSAKCSANASVTSIESLFSQVQPVAGPNIIPKEDMEAISRNNSFHQINDDDVGDTGTAVSHTHPRQPSSEGRADVSTLPPPPAPPQYKHFGYKDAFGLPCTRFILSQYMVLVAADTALKECLPLWVVASTAVGGFGLSQEVVGYILLVNAGPMLMSNLIFHKVCNYFSDRMGLFRLGACTTGVAAFFLPLGSYWRSVALGLLTVVVMTSIRQLFCSWLYSLNTMLTARCAPPGHVGSLMGINQSCGAAMRGLIPVIASPLFAWSIGTNGIAFINHTFVFFLSSLLFFWCSWRSYKIRTNELGNLEMVD